MIIIFIIKWSRYNCSGSTVHLEVVNIFRECFFEYAGKYSGDYNLIMAYVEDSNSGFVSGGNYTPSFDSVPASAESVLYSISHGENPLEFSVEIVNPEESIPPEQFMEIKEWLFGQDGWKKLTLESDDYYGYHLKCLLLPDSDIVDGTGYRGVRCTLKNVSGFWYGENQVIAYESGDIITAAEQQETLSNNSVFLYPDIKTQFGGRIYPVVNISTYINDGAPSSEYTLDITNMVSDSTPNSKRSGFNLNQVFSTAYHRFNINTQHGVIIHSVTYESAPWAHIDDKILPEGLDTSRSLLYFFKGINKVSVSSSSSLRAVRRISIEYTPMYMLGGF